MNKEISEILTKLETAIIEINILKDKVATLSESKGESESKPANQDIPVPHTQKLLIPRVKYDLNTPTDSKIEYNYYLIKDGFYVKVPECSTNYKFPYIKCGSFPSCDFTREPETCELLFVGNKIVMFSGSFNCFYLRAPKYCNGKFNDFKCLQGSVLKWADFQENLIAASCLDKFSSNFHYFGAEKFNETEYYKLGLYEFSFEFVRITKHHLSTDTAFYYELILRMDFKWFLSGNLHGECQRFKDILYPRDIKLLLKIDAEKFMRILNCSQKI